MEPEHKFNTKIKFKDIIGNIILPKNLKTVGYCIRCGQGVFEYNLTSKDSEKGICPDCSWKDYMKENKKAKETLSQNKKRWKAD